MDRNEYRQGVQDRIDKYEKLSPDVVAGLHMVSEGAQKTGKLDPKMRSLIARALSIANAPEFTLGKARMAASISRKATPGQSASNVTDESTQIVSRCRGD